MTEFPEASVVSSFSDDPDASCALYLEVILIDLAARCEWEVQVM